MNEQSNKLLTLLSKCRPEDEELALASRRSEIIQSPAYKKLKRRTSYRQVFNSVLSEEKLSSYNAQELESLQQALPHMEDFLKNLVYSLKNGCCPQLVESDRPSFMEGSALEVLSDRLEEGSGRNYCNIEPADCMKIFDGDTVKSIRNRFLDLPKQCDNYEEAIAELFPEQSYCISEAEIMDLEREYQDQVSYYLGDAEKEKGRKFARKLIKLAITLAAMTIPWFVGRLTGGVSDTAMLWLTIGILIVAIVCWKKG